MSRYVIVPKVVLYGWRQLGSDLHSPLHEATMYLQDRITQVGVDTPPPMPRACLGDFQLG